MLDHLHQPALDPASVAAVEARARVCTIGLITAYRSGATDTENATRDAQLRIEARRSGLGFVRLHGCYRDGSAGGAKDEWAILAFSSADDHGLMKGFLIKHGSKYDQEAAFWKPCRDEGGTLIGTRSDGFLGPRETLATGKWHATQLPAVHAILRGIYGRPTIRFERCRIVNQVSFFSRRAQEFS